MQPPEDQPTFNPEKRVALIRGVAGLQRRRSVVETGDFLGGNTQYIVETLQEPDGTWYSYTVWVDTRGEGHRVLLPHQVFKRMLDHGDSIRAVRRSQRSRAAAATARAKRLRQIGEE